MGRTTNRSWRLSPTLFGSSRSNLYSEVSVPHYRHLILVPRHGHHLYDVGFLPSILIDTSRLTNYYYCRIENSPLFFLLLFSQFAIWSKTKTKTTNKTSHKQRYYAFYCIVTIL